MKWDGAIRALGGTPVPAGLESRYTERIGGVTTIDHVRQVVRDAVASTEGRDRALAGHALTRGRTRRL